MIIYTVSAAETELFKDSLRYVESNWERTASILSELTDAEAWEVIPPGNPYGSLDRMVEIEVGMVLTKLEERIKAARARGLTTAREFGANGAHNGDSSYNIRGVAENAGTGLTYTVRRLKRDRPELADKVIAGEMSANAAAIEAGFRRKTMTVSADDADAAMATLLRRYSRDELQQALNRNDAE